MNQSLQKVQQKQVALAPQPLSEQPVNQIPQENKIAKPKNKNKKKNSKKNKKDKQDLKSDQLLGKIDKTKFKTEMCKNWIEQGYCRYGTKCQFAHGN